MGARTTSPHIKDSREMAKARVKIRGKVRAKVRRAKTKVKARERVKKARRVKAKEKTGFGILTESAEESLKSLSLAGELSEVTQLDWSGSGPVSYIGPLVSFHTFASAYFI